MDQGVVDTADGRASATPAPAEPPSVGAEPAPASSSRPRRQLAVDLSILAVVGLLLIAAVGAAAAAMSREFYSPTAFVQQYLDLLAGGRAAEALAVPGVTVDSAALEAAGLPANASQALLRRDALASLTDIRIVSEHADGDVTHVKVAYRAGAYPGTTTFDVVRDGSVGLAPTWRFATSPLAVMDLKVSGSMSFEVNGFTMDKRQVSPDGVDADPDATLPLLVFSPGVYSVSVDTPISATPGAAVLSDSPFSHFPVEIRATATARFTSLVQQRVDEFLTTCTTQQVLQPTGCPFGLIVDDRIASTPVWSIAHQPTVQIVPDGAKWRVPPTDAVAHIEVDIQSLFDGSIRHVGEDVPFLVTGSITVLPDGTATIVVGGPDTN
ncbi:hypothetical protein [Microbacterium deminutum]|uniref:DUF2993 domain-containing protein n=1 Tax=Microbacterium deminutum TaxID=344164 RepID=A0ABP5C2H2_9MICO